MKHQLSECNMDRAQNFSFGSILSTFFFERVPGLSPRVDVPLHGVRYPAQWHWPDAMRRLGVCRVARVANPYPADFFPWWRRQIVAIEDYPYVGIDFRGDPDMPLPPGLVYGDIGNESRPLLFLKYLKYLSFCVFLINGIKKTWFWLTIHNDIYHSCADVGPQ